MSMRASSRDLDRLAHALAQQMGCSRAEALAALQELQRAGLVAIASRGVALPLAPRSPIAEAIHVL